MPCLHLGRFRPFGRSRGWCFRTVKCKNASPDRHGTCAENGELLPARRMRCKKSPATAQEARRIFHTNDLRRAGPLSRGVAARKKRAARYRSCVRAGPSRQIIGRHPGCGRPLGSEGVLAGGSGWPGRRRGEARPLWTGPVNNGGRPMPRDAAFRPAEEGERVAPVQRPESANQRCCRAGRRTMMEASFGGLPGHGASGGGSRGTEP